MALRYGSKVASALRYGSYNSSILRYNSHSLSMSVGEATPDHYFTFTLLDNGTYSIAAADVTTLPKDVVLPSTYNGKAVTVIADNGFSNSSLKEISMESIYIPASITTIGSRAFMACVTLTKIRLGKGSNLTSIGEKAFAAAGYNVGLAFNLEEATKLSTIGEDVFDNAWLKEITIPDSVTSIGRSAFAYCSSLTSVVIPDSVTYIGDYAFEYCSNLTMVYIPNSVATIGNWAFYDCDSLTICTLAPSKPDGWDEGWNPEGRPVAWGSSNPYEYLTFTELDNGTYEVKPTDISTIPSEIVIPATYNGKAVTKIKAYGFQDCTNISKVIILNGITSIGSGAFEDCSKLADITVPDSVTSMGSNAFFGTKYYYTESNWVDKVLYVGKHLLHAETNISGEYVVKDGTITIADNAFFSRTSLVSVVIPDSVVYVGSSAFYSCSKLTIYCEATEQPSSWDYRWNNYGGTVVWGYTG